MNLNCRSCRTSIPRKRRGNHKQTTTSRLAQSLSITLLVTTVSINQIRILMPLAYWQYTFSLKFLSNIKIFVDVADQVKFVTQMLFIFLKSWSYVGRLDIKFKGSIFGGAPGQSRWKSLLYYNRRLANVLSFKEYLHFNWLFLVANDLFLCV